jgi:mitochondrial-processing peptidase subunit alpha
VSKQLHCRARATMSGLTAGVIPVCVLDTLLGGGSSFSAGGPGKGLYTRLYREVLNRFGWVEAANAFSIQYDDNGVFGMYGSCFPESGGDLFSVMVTQLSKLGTTIASPEELSRARHQLRSSVLMNLESRAILAEDIGRQVLTLGERMPPMELCDRIMAVSEQDLLQVAKDALRCPPSLATVNVDADKELHAALVQYFGTVAKDFGSS